MRTLTIILVALSLLLPAAIHAQMIGSSCSDQIGDTLWVWMGSTSGLYRVVDWNVTEVCRYGTGGRWQATSTACTVRSGTGGGSVTIDWNGFGPEQVAGRLFTPCAGERCYMLIEHRQYLPTGQLQTLTVQTPWSFVDPLF